MDSTATRLPYHLGSSAPPRRPPPPPRRFATVTRLGEGPPEDDLVEESVQGMLALDLGRADVPPPPPLALVPEATADRRAEELRVWAGQFAQAVVEVLGGDRPVTQLLRWTTREVYVDLGLRVRVLGSVAPAEQRLRLARAQVRSVRVSRPGAGVAEISVHVRHGRRSRAIAGRLERRQGRWQCTVLQFG